MEVGHWGEKKPSFSSFISTPPPRSFSKGRISPTPITTECVSPDCPVKERHHMYEYWHNGKQPHREDWEIFHGSNPPGNVWRSYNRLQCPHRGGCGALADIERVRQFRRHHGCCCCCSSHCCKSSSSSSSSSNNNDDDDNLDLQCRRWKNQEKLWEMGILAEEGGGEAEKGGMIPPHERTGKKKQEEITTEHNHHQKKKRFTSPPPSKTVDYLQPGDKSSYHEHRMRVLKYRQRQKDKRREISFAYVLT